MLVLILSSNIMFSKVKKQCDFTPLEDKIPVMVRSNALKTPISKTNSICANVSVTRSIEHKNNTM